MGIRARSRILNLCSPQWDPYDSYGIISNNLLLHFTKRGYHVNAIGLEENLIYSSHSARVKELLSKPIKVTTDNVYLGYPTLYEKYHPLIGSGRSVALTMFESEKLPEGWSTELNRWIDHLVVPNPWGLQVFKNAGVEIPISWHDLSVEHGYRYRGHWKRPTDRPFRFLTIGDRGIRKGWWDAAVAFSRAFGEDPNYELWIKARKDALPLRIKHPQIKVIEGDYTLGEMVDLFHSVDAFVWLSHGEGWGIPPRNAVVSGLPVISTNYSGMEHDINSWGYPVPWVPERAWEDSPWLYEQGSVWAKPDIDRAGSLMLYLAKTGSEAAISYTVNSAATNLRKNYSWAKLADHLLEKLQESR